MNTTENNKSETNRLIAEFMGIVFTKDNKANHPRIKAPYPPIECFKYHSDWNWLMEVVEKIESLGYGFNFFFKKDKCYVSISNFESNVFVGANGVDYNTQPNKIEAAYNACVTFIEWYNNQTAQEK